MHTPKVYAVSLSPKHTVRKVNQSYINLIAGFGVEGDAHAGKKVKHRYLVRKDPERPNYRQVHFISLEIYNNLKEQGFAIKAGDMGENITTAGIDIMKLPEGTIFKIGEVEVEITGMREPCHLLNDIEDGLMKATIRKDGKGQLIRKAGIMGVILKGGIVVPGDEIELIYPEPPYKNMVTI